MTKTTPTLRRGIDMKAPEPVTWLLAPNYLVSGRANLLVGEEGIGKSMWTIRALATVSAGRPWGPFTIPSTPRDVIVIATEDGWADTVRPRLEVAGADLERVYVFSERDDGEGSPLFPRDMPRLRDSELKPALVVVDSWIDTVPGGLNVKDTQQCREAIKPWKTYAADTGAAVLLVTHTNRLASANARDTYGLSAGLRQVVRSSVYVMRDGDELLVGPEKNNLGGTNGVAEKFTITPVPKFAPTPGSDGTVGRLDYLGSSDRTVKQHLVDRVETAGPSRDRRTAAVDQWLDDYFGPGDMMEAAGLDAAARDAGFSTGQLRRAKDRLGVSARKVGTTWFVCRDAKLTNCQDAKTDSEPYSSPISSYTDDSSSWQSGNPSSWQLDRDTHAARTCRDERLIGAAL